MSSDALASTRHALHAVAELVLAGSQYAACNRVPLRVLDQGFATRFDPDVRVEGADVYSDGADLDLDEVLHLDPDAAGRLFEAWADGASALLQAAPGCDPTLWPEHFDVGITVDEVNLGVSPGDSFCAVPYAYVGPWSVPEGDPFFDAPFGAAREVSTLAGADGITAFFVEGLARLVR